MRRTLTAAMLALTALAVLPAVAQADIDDPYIQVEGEGAVQAAPDRATVSAGVETRAPNAVEAMRANADAMSAVMAELAKAGVEDRMIRTSQLSVYPVFNRSDRDVDQSAPIAYEATNQVEATVAEIAAVGEVIDALVGAGVNRFQGVRFSIDDATALEDEALRRAIADARRKATLVAEAAGVRLGAPLLIEARGGGRPAPVMRMTLEAGQATSVAPGEQSVSAGVSMRFAILE